MRVFAGMTAVLGVLVIVACGDTAKDETATPAVDAGASSDAGAVDAAADASDAEAADPPVPGAVACAGNAKDLEGKPCNEGITSYCGSSVLDCSGCTVSCKGHRWVGAGPTGSACWNLGPEC